MRSVLAGSKTQVRLLGTSPLRECRAGDRLWVKEQCVGGKSGATGDVTAQVGKAEFIVFADGWRHYRSGLGCKGAVPTGRTVKWTTGIHMPRWSARTMLIVETVSHERLQDIDPDNIRAEGLLPVIAGWYLRLRRPNRGLWRDPRHAYAAIWNADHTTRGERWEDNPKVVVLNFRLESR